MSRSILVSSLAVVLVAALCTAVVASGDSVPSPTSLPQIMLTDLVIEPSTQHENAYECAATLVDTRTGETLAAPRVLFPSGEDAQIRSGVALGDEKADVHIVVQANADARTASVRVELTRDSSSTTVQRLRVRL
jgi:hypothetical protein